MDGGVKKTWAKRDMGVWVYEKPYRSLLAQAHSPIKSIIGEIAELMCYERRGGNIRD